MEYFGAVQSTNYDRVLSTDHYSCLLHWKIADLISFLRTFNNKPACWFMHETRKRVDDVFLTPENCRYSEWYTGCGHPELNGMLVAIVLAEALLMQDDTGNRGKHIDIVMPAYEQRTLQDDGAARIYADPTLLRNPDGSIRVLTEVRELQKYGGELAQRKCHELADALERSLLNK